MLYLIQSLLLLQADDVQVKVCAQAGGLVKRQPPSQPVPVGLEHRWEPYNNCSLRAAASNAIQTMMLERRRGSLDMTSYCTLCNIRQCYCKMFQCEIKFKNNKRKMREKTGPERRSHFGRHSALAIRETKSRWWCGRSVEGKPNLVDVGVRGHSVLL